MAVGALVLDGSVLSMDNDLRVPVKERRSPQRPEPRSLGDALVAEVPLEPHWRRAHSSVAVPASLPGRR